MEPIQKNKSLPNAVLFGWVEEEIAAGRAVHFRVKGGSMRPWLPEGTEVKLKPCDTAGLRPGDIVLFRYQGGHVMHRIVQRRDNHLLLQGDAVVGAYETCEVGDVVGIVRQAVRSSGRLIRCDQFRWRILFRGWRALGRGRGWVLRVMAKL